MNSASLLLVSVGHEREVIRYMNRLAGASLNETGCELTHFAGRGESKRVKMLLEHGLDPNGIESEKLESNLIPIIAAARIGDLEMVKMFIEFGADLDRFELSSKSNICHILAQHGHNTVRSFNFLLYNYYLISFPINEKSPNE